ncbi:MAG: hypothetical protein AB1469_01925 [Pseudomonadota bacterium]
MDKKLAIVTTSLVLFSGAALAIPTHKDFLALDADKDGYLSTEEYQGYQNSLQKDFGQADVSQDGKVSLDEFKASSKIWNDPFAGAGSPLTPPMVSGAQVSVARTTDAAGAETSQQMSGAVASGDIPAFEELDKNKDDKLSKQEYEAAEGARMRGAETQKQIQKDIDKPGMLQEEVMEATDPKMLQDGASDVGKPAQGGGQSGGGQ